MWAPLPKLNVVRVEPGSRRSKNVSTAYRNDGHLTAAGHLSVRADPSEAPTNPPPTRHTVSDGDNQRYLRRLGVGRSPLHARSDSSATSAAWSASDQAKEKPRRGPEDRWRRIAAAWG